MSDEEQPGYPTYRGPDADQPLTKADLVEFRSLSLGIRRDTKDLIRSIGELVRTQTRPIWIAVGVVVIMVLSFAGLAWYFYDKADSATVQAQHAVDKVEELSEENADLVEELHTNAVVACEGGNDRLWDQEHVWIGLVLQSKAETPAEQHAFDLINEHVRKVYKPRDCEHLDVPYEPAGPFPDLGLKP